MVSTRFRIATALLAFSAAFPMTVYSEDTPTQGQEKYVSQDAQKLREEKAKLEAQIEKYRADTKLPKDMRNTFIDGARQLISEIDSQLAPAETNEKAANRKAAKIVRDENEILKLKQEVHASNLAWAESEEKGIAYSPQTVAELQVKHKKRIERIAFLERRIGRKEASFKKKIGEDYRKPSASASEDKGTEAPPAPPEMSDDEKQRRMAIPGCWKLEDGKDKTVKMTVYFDPGKSPIKPGDEMGETKADGAFMSQVNSAYDEVFKTGRIGHVKVTSSVSRIPRPKGMTEDQLAMAREEELKQKFNAALTVSNHPTLPGAIDAYAPMEASASPFEIAQSGSAMAGPEYRSTDVGFKKRKVIRNKEECAKDFYCSKSERFVNKTKREDSCEMDDICRKAKALFEKGDAYRSPALVKDASGALDLQATMKNLEDCCSANYYELMYKPHQFVQWEITPAKFDPKAESCKDSKTVVQKADKGDDAAVGLPGVSSPTSQGGPSGPSVRKSGMGK